MFSAVGGVNQQDTESHLVAQFDAAFMAAAMLLVAILASYMLLVRAEQMKEISHETI